MSARLPDLNDGRRLSRLDLDRRLTGELPAELHGPEADQLRAHQAELAESHAALPPFDLAAIEARATRVEEEGHAADEPGGAEVISLFGRRRLSPLAVVAPLLAAALVLLSVRLPPPSHYAGTKGSVGVEVYVQRDDGAARVHNGDILHEGDRIRFATRADGYEDVVVLSVDGAGIVSVFYPDDADADPLPVPPFARQLLPDAIELDDAVGPELYVAVYGAGDTAAAIELVGDAWQSGGADAVAALARTVPGVAVLSVEKQP